MDTLEGLLARYCDATAILYFLDEPLEGSRTAATIMCFIDTAAITITMRLLYNPVDYNLGVVPYKVFEIMVKHAVISMECSSRRNMGPLYFILFFKE